MNPFMPMLPLMAISAINVIAFVLGRLLKRTRPEGSLLRPSIYVVLLALSILGFIVAIAPSLPKAAGAMVLAPAMLGLYPISILMVIGIVIFFGLVLVMPLKVLRYARG